MVKQDVSCPFSCESSWRVESTALVLEGCVKTFQPGAMCPPSWLPTGLVLQAAHRSSCQPRDFLWARKKATGVGTKGAEASRDRREPRN